MSIISIICFMICFGIILSIFRKGADPFSPSRVFGFIWSLAIGLMDLKFSGLQHTWSIDSWILMLIGPTSFLIGTFITYVLHLNTELVPINTMRLRLREEQVNEHRLFRLVTLSVAVYSICYLVIFFVKGWLPIFVVGTKFSRVDFYVFGFGVLINSTAFIVFFTLLYAILVKGNKKKKIFLITICTIALLSYFLLLQRFQIMMAIMLSFVLLYYATQHIRFKTVIFFSAIVWAFIYWIMSMRLGQLALTYTYWTAKMKFPETYALLTEPYMYLVMNLENFARSVTQSQYHTYGYFSFDFITAMSGLKYWIVEYFNLNRTPYLTSGYNTYSAFWWFYSDFGVIGLLLLPFVLGFSMGQIYYRMRSRPTIKTVTAYGVMVFIIFFSFIVFPIAYLWFEYNLLAMYLILRWTILPQNINSQTYASITLGTNRKLLGGA